MTYYLKTVIISKNKKEYSLFGSADDNIAFFYSFLDQYIDFNSGNTEFNSDKFSEDLDSIYSLIKNDTTDENVNYFLLFFNYLYQLIHFHLKK